MPISSRAPAVRSYIGYVLAGAHRRGATSCPMEWLWTSFDAVP